MKEFLNLKKELDKIKHKNWIECSEYSNGLMIEKLLKIPKNTFEVPDYDGIEIKSKKRYGKSNFTLFNATPDNNFFEIKRIQKNYGYPDKENKKYKVFNINISAINEKILVKNSFKLFINYKKEFISLLVWDNKGNLIDSETSWSFSMLKEKLFRKLSYLCFIQTENKIINNVKYFKITNYNFYKLISFNNFLKLLESGKICISFKIGVFKSGKRIGQIRDRGTSFSLDYRYINSLFSNCKL